MKTFKALVIVCAIILLNSSYAVAQDEITEAKRSDIILLLETTNAVDLGIQLNMMLICLMLI